MKQSNNQVGEKYWCWARDNWGRQCWRRWFRRSHSVMVPLALLCQGDPGDKQSKRRSSIHQQLADAGARFIPVDIADSSVAALKDQFHGFDTIINCMGFVAGAGTQIKITRAVLEAGVKRYFRQFGVNYDVVGKGSGQPVWDEQYDVRTLLREQNVTEWVIVSTGIFTSFLFEPAFDVVNLDQKPSMPSADGKGRSPSRRLRILVA